MSRRAWRRAAQAGAANARLLDPVGYLDMVALEAGAARILTDSGGVQKEAYLLGVPCVTRRDTTEWTETLGGGWNRLVGADAEAILDAASQSTPTETPPPVFGDGRAGRAMAGVLADFLGQPSA